MPGHWHDATAATQVIFFEFHPEKICISIFERARSRLLGDVAIVCSMFPGSLPQIFFSRLACPPHSSTFVLWNFAIFEQIVFRCSERWEPHRRQELCQAVKTISKVCNAHQHATVQISQCVSSMNEMFCSSRSLLRLKNAVPDE
jgi:hypothetical protein